MSIKRALKHGESQVTMLQGGGGRKRTTEKKKAQEEEKSRGNTKNRTLCK